jgi:hypothetical protein
MASNASEIAAPPRRVLLVISIAQAFAVSALLLTYARGTWPSEDPLFAVPLWTLVVMLPLWFLLALKRGNGRRLLLGAAVATVVLLLAALYVGWQATPWGEFGLESLAFVYAVTLSLACFKGLMYLQRYSDRQPFDYSSLFRNSWRNFLVLCLSAVFTVLFWVLVRLWGELFDLIGITFFSRLFRTDWFIIPVLIVAFGLAVVSFRELTRVIDVIARLLSGLIRLLLPLVVIVAVLFLLALLVVGLDALWSTGQGTRLLLWLVAAMLFFANAVYQDGTEAMPYPKAVHRLIYGGLCVTPVLGALALYGLAERIGQYGWTIERSWAVVAWSFLMLFSLGYVWGIVRRRDAWTAELARVNTVMGIVVAAVMVLANSPLLDFRRISLASQVARVERGDIEAEALDYAYIGRNLARPGYQLMNGEEQPGIELSEQTRLAIANAAHAAGASAGGLSDEEVRARFWRELTYRPEPFAVSPELRAEIERASYDAGTKSVLLRIDLNRDGQHEYVLVHRNGDNVWASWYRHVLGEWREEPILVSTPSTAVDLQSAPIEIRDSEFSDLKIGDVLLELAQPE